MRYLSSKFTHCAVKAVNTGKSVPALLNAARRQTIRAFREHGHWKITANEPLD